MRHSLAEGTIYIEAQEEEMQQATGLAEKGA